MLRGRPARIQLASAALTTVALADTAWFTASRLSTVARCGESCAGEFEPMRFGASLLLLVLAVGLLVRPTLLRLPTAIASAALAITWVGPVLDSPESFGSPEVAMLALSLLSATPFLLVRPIGRGSSRWALIGWIGATAIAVLMFLFDTWGASFLATTAPPLQVGFLVVAGALLGAGFLSRRLSPLEPPEATMLAAAS